MNSAVVEVANPFDRSQPKTMVGIISPVTAMPENVMSAVEASCSESAQAQTDLATVLDKSVNGQQQAQLLDLYANNHYVFSLSQKN